MQVFTLVTLLAILGAQVGLTVGFEADGASSTETSTTGTLDPGTGNQVGGVLPRPPQ